MTIKTLRPTSDGTAFGSMLYDSNGNQPPSPNAYSYVNDQSDSTWLYPDVVSGGQSFHCTAYTLPSGEKITNVRVWIRIMTILPGAGFGIAPTLYFGSLPLIYGATRSSLTIANFSSYWNINPHSGVAWTEADINNTQFGFYGFCNLLHADPFCYEVWIEVTSAIPSKPSGNTRALLVLGFFRETRRKKRRLTQVLNLNTT